MKHWFATTNFAGEVADIFCPHCAARLNEPLIPVRVSEMMPESKCSDCRKTPTQLEEEYINDTYRSFYNRIPNWMVNVLSLSQETYQ